MNDFSKRGRGILLMALFLFAAAFTPLFSNKKSGNSALDYLNTVTGSYDKVGRDMWGYVRAASHNNFALAAENRRKKLVKTVGKSIKDVRRIPAFKGDDSLTNAALTYLNILHDLLTNDYAKIVDMEEVAEESYDLMEAYLLAKKRAGDSLDVASEHLQKSVKEFAGKNNIKLIEGNSRIGLNLKEASKVYDYYNKIYLLFFKSYKEEAYIRASLQLKDEESVELHSANLVKFSKDALASLKKIGGYNNKDLTLSESCEELLNYYIKESGKKLEFEQEYARAKSAFEEQKEAFEAIGESARTQADIDGYNGEVEKYNAAVNKFNSDSKALNDKRNLLVKEWNKTVKGFLNKNVPK